MKLLLDFLTIGEPHYAQGISADRITPNVKKFYAIEENGAPIQSARRKGYTG
ncbi:MAG: hypothetical protein R2788_08995 [Saprospiraceae bacterium]